jgi:hypothetical protein
MRAKVAIYRCRTKLAPNNGAILYDIISPYRLKCSSDIRTMPYAFGYPMPNNATFGINHERGI